ncbi:MAG TPA: hypothetical protein VJQ82_03095 [Terriglobales bacterium]|nr:hypothetical protein [Terriglobales bacterium]
MNPMKILALIGSMLVAGCVGAIGQAKSSQSPTTTNDYSGMYSFLRDGEFVQITVEDEGRVTGFVSRYGEQDSDRGAFLDQFFKEGKLDGKNLSFTTETVHAVRFEFKGTIERGEGKNPGDEAYYLVKGTLTEYATDENKKTTTKVREVVFKEFPQDVQAPSAKRN